MRSVLNVGTFIISFKGVRCSVPDYLRLNYASLIIYLQGFKLFLK